MVRFSVNLVWIKSEFGGRTHPPFVGMRPEIRFQRYIEEFLNGIWDVEVLDLEIDEITWSGSAILQLSSHAPNNLKGLEASELIELLDSYRVIAVGKIIKVNP